MSTKKRLSLPIAGALLMTLGLTGPAHAVPCGLYSAVGGIKLDIPDTTIVDLGASSATCRNGGIGDANDSVADLNDGNFFGHSDWLLVDKTDDGIDVSWWSFSPQPTGTSGSFTVKDAAWGMYSHLIAVLKDGGSTTNKDIKWSAYLLPQDINGPFDWSYDNRKNISHISLYGVVAPVSVPEPATLAVFAVALAASIIALRTRRQRSARIGK